MNDGNGKRNWIREYFMASLAILIVLCSFSMFYLIIFTVLSGSNRDVAMFVLGSVTTALITVLNYYFGSSHGSSEKDKTIKEMNTNGKAG